MKAIILAAGKGSRISDQIEPVPKCMLKINEKPIIVATVEVLLSLNVKPIICTGYKAEQIRSALSGMSVIFYHNPFFDITNNIVSLWFARDEINEDIILLNADIIFQKEVIEKLINHDAALTMAVDKSRTLDGDFFFRLTDEGCILDYGPNILPQLRSCEYVCLSKISQKVAEIFVKRLEDLIIDQKHQQYFETVFFSFITDPNLNVDTIDISGLEWREIDFYEDYIKALQQFEIK